MYLPKDRNDRVMLGTVASLIGLGLAVGLSNVTINAPAAADAVSAPARTERSGRSRRADRCRMRTP